MPTASTPADARDRTDAGAGEALTRCVGDVATFLDRHWGAEPLCRRGSPGDFDDLLALADVDHLVATTAPRRPALRLVRDGAPVPPSAYRRSGTVSGEPIEGLVDPGRVYDLFADGATIVLQSLQRSWAPLARFCRDLELVLSHPVQANAYLTPAGAAGLAPHHDTHDVFVLQVHGRKRWVVAEPLVEAPLPHQRAPRDEAGAQPVRLETEVAAGDVLYLPSGFIHSARAQAEASLHVTIGVVATTMADVARELVRLATEGDPGLRRPLPPGWAGSAEVLAGAVRSCAAALADRLVAADVEAVTTALARRAVAGRQPLLEGQLRELLALDRIGDATVVRRRPRAPLRTEQDGCELRLVLGDRTVVLPAIVGPAVQRLLTGDEVRVGDLADALDGPSRLVLVRRLVREGALVTDAAAAAGG